MLANVVPSELELQLPAYTAAAATQDSSHVYDVHTPPLTASRIFNPLRVARDRTCILMGTSGVPAESHWEVLESSI